MSTLKLRKVNATLVSWNPRSEMHGQDKRLASDLTLVASFPASIFETILADFGDASEKLMEFFWDGEDNVRETGLKKIEFAIKYHGHRATFFVDDEEHEFDNISVRKLIAKPKAGKRVELSFQVQIYPAKKDLSFIGSALTEDNNIMVKVEPLKGATSELETKKNERNMELPLGEENNAQNAETEETTEA